MRQTESMQSVSSVGWHDTRSARDHKPSRSRTPRLLSPPCRILTSHSAEEACWGGLLRSPAEKSCWGLASASVDTEYEQRGLGGHLFPGHQAFKFTRLVQFLKQYLCTKICGSWSILHILKFYNVFHLHSYNNSLVHCMQCIHIVHSILTEYCYISVFLVFLFFVHSITLGQLCISLHVVLCDCKS